MDQKWLSLFSNTLFFLFAPFVPRPGGLPRLRSGRLRHGRLQARVSECVCVGGCPTPTIDRPDANH